MTATPQEENRRLKEEDDARRAARLEVITGGMNPEAWAPEPSIFIRRPDSQARWGERKLSHKRAMQCFDRCVAIQAQQERNSLTRRARLLKAAKDLGLAPYINRAEISQRVLEAKDEQMGHAFRPLTAADRLAMQRPILRWLVPGLIPAEDMTIIGGRPKVGKTRLAIALVAAVLKGEPALGFEAPACRDVILITDDQSDADTAEMLEAHGIWGHPRLIWSRHFRLTEMDIGRMLVTIREHPGALLLLDSLRSISRSLQHGENDPEIGAILYDLKAATTEAGATPVVIHHCNKADGLVGTEALSGHNAIAGATNTVLTMHYVPDGAGRPLKDAPQRRLVREARSGEGFDLVISREAGQPAFHRVGKFCEWQQQAQQAAEEEKAANRLSTRDRKVLQAIADHGGWMTRRDVCEAVGVPWGDRGQDPKARELWRLLNRLKGDELVDTEPAGRESTYRISSHGTRLLESRESMESTSCCNRSDDSTRLASMESRPGAGGTIPTIPRLGINETPGPDSLVPLIPLIPPATCPPYCPCRNPPLR